MIDNEILIPNCLLFNTLAESSLGVVTVVSCKSDSVGPIGNAKTNKNININFQGSFFKDKIRELDWKSLKR